MGHLSVTSIGKVGHFTINLGKCLLDMIKGVYGPRTLRCTNLNFLINRHSRVFLGHLPDSQRIPVLIYNDLEDDLIHLVTV